MSIFSKKIKPLTISVIFATSIFSTISQAAILSADRSIFSEGTGTIKPKITFNQTESGDLYLATKIEGNLYFILNNGSLSTIPQPYLSNQEFNGVLDLPQFNTTGMPSGQYPLYQIITQPGTDVMNFSNWVGGIGALNVINFSIGLKDTQTGDFNSDGWSDDDLNHDGFHDDDYNKDGYHDDDHDKDGYHDDDTNKDGYHDNENNSEENENEYEDTEYEDSEHGSEDDEHEPEDDEHASEKKIITTSPYHQQTQQVNLHLQH